MLGRYRYVYLLASLMLLILVRPFLPDFGQWLLIALLTLTLVTASVASATRPRQVWIAIALTGVILATATLPHEEGATDMALLSTAFGVAFWMYTVMLILLRVFVHTTRVTLDTICGAASVYLMIGLGWAQAYAGLAAVNPGAFSFDGEILVTGAHSFDRFLGFSFVTLTTLGYGNIVPLTERADALAIGEAVVGQLYVTVLLARLVAMEIAHRTRQADEG